MLLSQVCEKYEWNNECEKYSTVAIIITLLLFLFTSHWWVSHPVSYSCAFVFCFRCFFPSTMNPVNCSPHEIHTRVSVSLCWLSVLFPTEALCTNEARLPMLPRACCPRMPISEVNLCWPTRRATLLYRSACPIAGVPIGYQVFLSVIPGIQSS